MTGGRRVLITPNRGHPTTMQTSQAQPLTCLLGGVISWGGFTRESKGPCPSRRGERN